MIVQHYHVKAANSSQPCVRARRGILVAGARASLARSQPRPDTRWLAGARARHDQTPWTRPVSCWRLSWSSRCLVGLPGRRRGVTTPPPPPRQRQPQPPCPRPVRLPLARRRLKKPQAAAAMSRRASGCADHGAVGHRVAVLAHCGAANLSHRGTDGRVRRFARCFARSPLVR